MTTNKLQASIIVCKRYHDRQEVANVIDALLMQDTGVVEGGDFCAAVTSIAEQIEDMVDDYGPNLRKHFIGLSAAGLCSAVFAPNCETASRRGAALLESIEEAVPRAMSRDPIFVGTLAEWLARKVGDPTTNQASWAELMPTLVQLVGEDPELRLHVLCSIQTLTQSSGMLCRTASLTYRGAWGPGVHGDQGCRGTRGARGPGVQGGEG